MAAAGKGRTERAVLLDGAARTMLYSLGVDLSGVLFWLELVDRYLGGVDREVDPGLTFEEAVQFGLDIAADRPALVGMDS